MKMTTFQKLDAANILFAAGETGLAIAVMRTDAEMSLETVYRVGSQLSHANGALTPFGEYCTRALEVLNLEGDAPASGHSDEQESDSD